VRPADHASVLRLLANHHPDLGSTRTRTAYRLHALVAELVAGGISNELSVSKAQDLLGQLRPTTAVEAARRDLAMEQLEDLRRLDQQRKSSKERLAGAVAASGTSLVELFGVGPVVAAMLISYSGDIARFADRHAYATYNDTAPCGRVIGRSGHRAARPSRQPPAQPRPAYRCRRPGLTPVPTAMPTSSAKVGEGMTKKETIRSLKCRISDVVYRYLLADAAK
jgi:transposase